MPEEVEVDSELLSKQRSDYYDKWHSFTKDEVAKAKQEEEKEKEDANEALGLNKGPKSQAEEDDMKKREALKEAKKKWEDKELSDAAKKFAIENMTDEEKVLDSVKLHWKPVCVFKNNKNCKFKLPHTLKHKLVKVFIESCVDCQIDFEVESVTQHVEMVRSKRCLLKIKKQTATVQVDISDDCTIWYGPGLFKGDKVRIFHAGVKNLMIDTYEGKEHKFSFTDEVDETEDRKKEIQFVTFLKDNKIVTETVIRDKGNLPSTQDELEEKELSAKSLYRDAQLKRLGGNEAFKENNYAQAAVFYTESLDVLSTAMKKGELEQDQDDFRHILYSNRAFCWQKLGHHDRAEEDARQCLELKPDFTKGIFRLGLALHAQKKYFEAVPILGKAHKAEPKNETIKQALGFAELQMRKMMRNDD